METAQRLVEKAATLAGYIKKVFHGTPNFGFTKFRTHRESGAIFTTTARNTAANYGGGDKYASVRSINKGIKEAKTTKDVLDNAKSRFDQNWREATKEERDAAIKNVESIAKKVLIKIQELNTDLSNLPYELQYALSWMESIIYDAAEGRENGNEGNSLSKMLKDGYEKFRENREIARQLIDEHYDELTPEQRRYWSYINGFEVGDAAIDAGHIMARAVSDSDLVTVDGRSFMLVNELNDITQQDKGVGTYRLYGDLGSNPLIIDAGHNAWYNLDYNGMTSTDSIAEWAKENGYTSVVLKNIYDYGDLSDVMVFYDSSQLKSADPVTYDDNGNIIPLSERFNPENPDIRYRTINEGETDLEFVESVVADFLNQYKSPVPITAVDVNDRAAVERATGLNEGEISDEAYQMIVDRVNRGSNGIYIADTKRIVIFADARNQISADVEEGAFHEIAHALADKNPAILELGEWLWNNADKGARKIVKEYVLSEGYPAEQQHNEMLSRYTGMMLALGKAGAVLEMLPAEQKKHWDYILKEIGYEPERDDESRRTRHSVDSSRRGVNRKVASETLSDNGAARNAKEARQNEAVGRLVGTARSIAIENAVNEVANKLGVKVTYKTREEMPKGHKNDKGYYNTKTGEIVVCPENASSISDAVQTILHEAVAHKGLRALMGDRFNEFINRVYESLDDATKAKVDALADTKYNGNKTVAMEEYMASLAETMDFENKSVWEKIKEAFEGIINSILGRNDIKIGDNELRYILRASYNHMSNPRTIDTLEGWAKDKMMREEYGINEAHPELLSRTGIDEIEFTSAREAYEAVTFNSFTEIANMLVQANGIKGKRKAAKSGFLKIWNEIQMEHQDSQQAVRAGIEAVQKETGNMPIEDFENYLLAENRMNARSAVEIEQFYDKCIVPMGDAINDVVTAVIESRGGNVTDENTRNRVYAEVVIYLFAKHGLERNDLYQRTRRRPLNKQEIKEAKEEAKAIYSDDLARAAHYKGKERKRLEEQAELDYQSRLEEIKTRTVPDVRDYAGLTGLFGFDPDDFEAAQEAAHLLVDEFEIALGSTDTQSSKVVENMWKRINASTSKILRFSYESGMISKAQYDEIKGMFKFYIPLRGFDETTAEDVYDYARFNGNRFQPTVMSAGGRTSVAFDPIAVMMNMATSAVLQGNKNRAKQALYNFVGNRPNSLLSIRDCWYVVDPVTGDFIEAYPDIANGETWEAFENKMEALAAQDMALKRTNKLDIGYRFQKPANKNEHYIHVMINGVEKAIIVNGNPRFAEGVNGFKDMNGSIVKGLKKANRAVSQLFTSYSYKFGGKNFFRDLGTGIASAYIKEDSKYMVKFANNWRKFWPVKIWKLSKAFKNGKLDLSKESHRLFKEFMENGGQTGYVYIDSLDKQRRKVLKAVENISKLGNSKTNTASKVRVLMDLIQFSNECFELTARVATYATSRQTKDSNGQMRSIAKSIYDAKEVTANFNRKGAQSGRGIIGGLAGILGSSVFFYNASVQGIAQAKGWIDNNPKRAITALSAMAGLGYVLPMILNIFNGDDDDEEEYYNLPEFQRKNNICLPIAEGNVTITIPLAPTIRDFYACGVTLNDAMFNKSVDRDATMVAMECAAHLAKAFIPANPREGVSSGFTPLESMAMFATPDVLDPFMEIILNKDYKGTPLEYRTSYNEGAPHYTKVVGKDNWKESVGEKLYKAGADNLDSKGDIPLYAFEHILTSMSGGIGTLIGDVANMVSWVFTDDAPDRLDEVPIARMLTSSNAKDDERFVNNIYWEMDEIYKRKTTVMSKVYGLTPKEAFEKEEGRGEKNLVKVYEAKSFPWMQRYYEWNNTISDMYDDIRKMPVETEADKADKVLAEQELFNLKREMVYELLEYEIE